MTKINLHEMFEARMNKLSEPYTFEADEFKDGYTAALNDSQACVDELEAKLARLQGKVDGLLKALEEHYEYAQDCRMDWSEYDGRTHLRVAQSINQEALAEFHAQADKNGGAK